MTSFNTSNSKHDNGSAEEFEDVNPISYRVLASVLHITIFLLGVAGNILLIHVVRRTRLRKKPTYCYLVSLAYADLLVLISAIPEAIIGHHIEFRWIFGQVGCSLMIFCNFLGINAGSLSLLTFTFERYMAVVHPMPAQKLCTLERANKVIIGAWVLAILYCSPWLGLTVVREEVPGHPTCELRFSPDQYLSFFTADLVLFYLIPLLAAFAAYWRIAARLKETSAGRVNVAETNVSLRKSRSRSTKQAVSLLLVVTVVFAVCWLPYRGLLFYNTIAQHPWLDLWYMLFAKTLIYINSSINPFLYSFVSRPFREAVKRSFTRQSSLRDTSTMI